MIETTMRDYLTAELTPVPVFLVVPPDPPDLYVFMEKIGGGETNLLKDATFAFQSVSEYSLEAAAMLNEAVKDALDGSVELPEIVRAKLNSDYNFTHYDEKEDATKRFRYQAVYDFKHY